MCDETTKKTESPLNLEKTNSKQTKNKQKVIKICTLFSQACFLGFSPILMQVFSHVYHPLLDLFG